MHYPTLVITAEDPTEAKIARIMKPFNVRTYCNKVLKLKREYGEEAAHERTKRPLFTWDWYKIVDSFKANTNLERGIFNLDEIAVHNCIDDVSEEVIVRKIWNGNDFVVDTDYDSKLKKIIERSKDKGYYMVIVDVHN